MIDFELMRTFKTTIDIESRADNIYHFLIVATELYAF